MATNKQAMVWWITGSFAVLGTWGAVAATGVLAEDTVVKADSFEDKHLRYEYVVELEAEGTAKNVNVTVSDSSHKVVSAAGKYTGIGEVLKNQETSDPACGSPCFTAWVRIYGHSEPGCLNGVQHPRINWVQWDFYTPVKLDGDAEVQFVAKVPGCFGKATLTTQGYTVNHKVNPWGAWSTTVTAQDPVVTVFEVVKA